MIKPPALLPIVDNSGAITVGCINVPKLKKRIGATPGTVIVASVKRNIFKKNIKKKSKIINKSQIVRILLLTTRRGIKRRGNFFIKTSQNSAVVINQYNDPYGTRLFGPIFRELRGSVKFKKVVNLAKFLI